MFKKYTFRYCNDEGHHEVNFYVNSYATRRGFAHRACVIGPVPRLDGAEDLDAYRANEDKLFNARFCKVTYSNRTWEAWSGQTVLNRLWARLEKLDFVDIRLLSDGDPFDSDEEPKHENIIEADELFRRF